MNTNKRIDGLDCSEELRYYIYKLLSVVTDLEADRLLQLAESGKKDLFKDALRIITNKYSNNLQSIDKIGLNQIYN